MDRFVLLPLLFGSLTPLTEGQGAGILGRDNADFARKLFEDGYPDLAEKLCRVIEGNGGSAMDLLAVKALDFELKAAALGREPDLQKRIDTLKSVIAEEDAFIQENARTSVADFVRANLPNVYLQLSTTMTAAIGSEQDPARRALLTADGQVVFENAKKNLLERRDRFATQLEEGSGDLDYATRQHLIASYNLARMEYQHALLYAPGSPEQKQHLEEALDLFGDFGYDYSDVLENFEGIIYQGLCHEGLGLLEDAETDYLDVIALRDDFETDENGVFLFGPEEGDVISGATRNLVRLYTRLGRDHQAIAAAEDYLERTPDPLLANSGLEVLAAKAEAEIASNDVTAASATAQQLVDADPQGWGGRKGRELLGRLPVDNLAPDQILKIAENAAGRGDFDRALNLCRQARESARGMRDEAETGAASFFLSGHLYRVQSKPFEASLAFDLAAELYPKSSKAPEALNAAVSVYRELAKRERSRFYSARADKQNQALAQRYPQHPLAANAGIYQGLRREDEGDFDGAREFYSKVPEGTPSFFEAQFRLGNATYSQARVVQQQGKQVEAKALMDKADQQYNAAIELLTKAKEEALDTVVQQRLAAFLVSCRMGLASLYIDTGKAVQVQELLAGLEQKVNDPEVIANIWSLRIRALQAEGKIDEAVKLFESVIATSPGSAGIASAAGVLARALDGSAQDQASSNVKRAEELWRKAAYYYSISVKGILDGTAALRSSEVLDVARRLYVIGLSFNKVPEGQATFVDWQGTVESPDLWEETARIYERLDAQAPSYEVSIERARTLAILGRIPEAEEIYARLFDQVTLFEADSNRFDTSVVEARPELASAYLEWGVTSHMVGQEQNDASRLDRAGEIYQRVINNYTDKSRLWWQARFFQIKLLSDQGDYKAAQLALQNVKRNTDPQFDKGQFGFKDKFVAMETELSKKVFDQK